MTDSVRKQTDRQLTCLASLTADRLIDTLSIAVTYADYHFIITRKVHSNTASSVETSRTAQ